MIRGKHMPQYTYRAADEEGQAFEDTVEAVSAFSLTQHLESEGLRVSSVEFVGLPAPERTPLNRLSWDELRLFTEQLSAITHSGYPLAPALSAMATDLHQPRLRAATDRLRQDIESGASLEDAFRMQEGRFPPLYSALVRAGELTGDLASVLEMMTQHATRMAAVKHRVKMAMAYPTILFVSACAVVLYQLLYIVPVFEDIFGEMKAQLPAPTQFLLLASTFLRGHWPTLTIAAPLVLVCLVALYVFMKRNTKGRRILDACLLYFPGLGIAYHGVVQARFCRTFSLLLGARVPMIDAMLLAGAASGSGVLEQTLQRGSEEVAWLIHCEQRSFSALVFTGSSARQKTAVRWRRPWTTWQRVPSVVSQPGSNCLAPSSRPCSPWPSV
jgi:type IV pilus assembly protein PilC